MGDNEIDMFNKQEFHIITKGKDRKEFDLFSILETNDQDNKKKIEEIKKIITDPDSTAGGTFKKISNSFKDLSGNMGNIVLIISVLFFNLSALYLLKEANDENTENDEETEPSVVEDITDSIQDTIQDNKHNIGYIHSGIAGLHLLSLIYYFYNNRDKKEDQQGGGISLANFNEMKDGARESLRERGKEASSWFSSGANRARESFRDSKESASGWFSGQQEKLQNIKRYSLKDSFINFMKIIAHFIGMILHTYYALQYLEVFSDVSLFHRVLG